MFRSHTCGELRLADAGKNVTLAGWVQRARKMGGMTFVDLRDRYGITQLVFNTEVNAELCERANHLGREFVIQVKGTVSERSSKNANIPTGEIEIITDEAIKKELWQDWFINHFPGGPTDPNYVILKFKANHATYWIEGKFIHRKV